MGDAGEGLIDANARIAERMEEQEQMRLQARSAKPKIDPERFRTIESLRLARTELQRQEAATTHPARREQIGHAIEEIDRRLAELTAADRA